MANTKFGVILEMLFLKLSNADVSFNKETFTWRTYTTNKALSAIKRVKIINKKTFVIMALDRDRETLVVHVAIREQREMLLHSKKQASIGALIFDEASIIISTKYSNYSIVFSADYTVELLEHTKINDNAIKLEEDKQPIFGPIYNLGSIKLETLKTYIKTNLAISFIRLSKSLAGALILFEKKPNGSFCFCVDYWSFNNLTIKNQYLLLLISKSLDWLGRTKQFTKLDLTNIYDWMRICEGNK